MKAWNLYTALSTTLTAKVTPVDHPAEPAWAGGDVRVGMLVLHNGQPGKHGEKLVVADGFGILGLG